LLMERVSKKQNRPLLKNPDPRGVLEKLMGERYPVYAMADITVPTRSMRRSRSAFSQTETPWPAIASRVCAFMKAPPP
ncbi:MAG: hypothetical protein E5V89_20725, partial [Mesorhizobium sp.]